MSEAAQHPTVQEYSSRIEKQAGKTGRGGLNSLKKMKMDLQKRQKWSGYERRVWNVSEPQVRKTLEAHRNISTDPTEKAHVREF